MGVSFNTSRFDGQPLFAPLNGGLAPYDLKFIFLIFAFEVENVFYHKKCILFIYFSFLSINTNVEPSIKYGDLLVLEKKLF